MQQALCVCVGGHDAVNAFRLSIPHLRTLPMTRYRCGSTDSKWKWEVPSSCSFLSGALTQVYIHTAVSIGPTHARLDDTLGSRSGDCQWKRKFHYSHTPVSAPFQRSASGFPVSSGICIKRYATQLSAFPVNLSKSLFWWSGTCCWYWQYEAGCVLPVCSLLLFSGQHSNKGEWKNIAEEEITRSPQTAECCESEPAGGFLFITFFIILTTFWSHLSFLITMLLVFVLQQSEKMLYTPPRNIEVSQTNFKIILTVWSPTTLNICGCLLIVVVLPPTIVTNYHVPATVGVHQMMWDVKKCISKEPITNQL